MSGVEEGLARLRMDDVVFVPVRHHSPACALALQAMLRELRPSTILIEGPDSFDALLPLLRDARTKPPVAILSQAQPPGRGADADGDGGETPPAHSAFFPFCDYSPEWVALRMAPELGATTAFIDLPWDAPGRHREPARDGADSLMAERYLAHSAYLKALAAASGCRDQDELWDHLFELRPGPPRATGAACSPTCSPTARWRAPTTSPKCWKPKAACRANATWRAISGNTARGAGPWWRPDPRPVPSS